VRTLEESAGRLPAAAITSTYAAAVDRWPRDPVLLFAAANEAYARKALGEAGELYERLLAADPMHAAGRNNFANLLLDYGCPRAAERQAQAALATLGDGPASNENFRAAIEDTLALARRAIGTDSAVPEPCD